MLPVVNSLKLQAALKLLESADYELDDVLQAIAEPHSKLDYLLAEIAHDDDFWLLIDSKYCDGELTTNRLDVPPDKRRLFIEGYVKQHAYIYVSERYLNLQIHKIDEHVIVGRRAITYNQVSTNLIDRDQFVTTDQAGLRITHEALEIKNLKPEKGCRGFAVGIGYYSDVSEI